MFWESANHPCWELVWPGRVRMEWKDQLKRMLLLMDD